MFKMLFLLVVSLTLLLSSDLKDYEPQKDFTKKINVAYYQGGDYRNYPLFLKSLVKSLSDFGWLNPIDLGNEKTTKDIWTKLGNEAKSPYLTFKKDAFYSLDWDEKKRKTISSQLMQRKDIDMIFALGTWAGQDLSNEKLTVPTFVMSASSPITSGILKDSKHASNSLVFVSIDEKSYKRQVSIFHKIFKFKTLGIVYEDTIPGKSYASLNDIEDVSVKNNFKIKSCKVNSNNKKELREGIIECYKKLARSNVDAIYITTNPAYKSSDIQYFIEDINTHKIPTFSELGSSQVKYGALMSIFRADFKYLGNFYAKAIGKTMNGTKPSTLNFEFDEPIKLAINLQTAILLNWDIPLNVVAISDELYQKILTKNSLDLKGQ